MRRRRPRGEGVLLLHGGGAAVALCRDRAALLADAIRHRYALADAHRAYAASLRDAAATLHNFLRGVQMLSSSSTCLMAAASTGRGTNHGNREQVVRLPQVGEAQRHGAGGRQLNVSNPVNSLISQTTITKIVWTMEVEMERIQGLGSCRNWGMERWRKKGYSTRSQAGLQVSEAKKTW
uniref:DUF630 domain-containing protein n=1 Tax=Oryza meridionalis TaxID=40149 RepID=A0A0E0E7H1_9ORYZ